MSQFEKTTPLFAEVLSVLHATCFEKAWDKDAFLSLLSLPTTIGLFNEKSFILCSVCFDEAEILTIGVVPSEQRKGLGFKLLQEIQLLLKVFYISSCYIYLSQIILSNRLI